MSNQRSEPPKDEECRGNEDQRQRETAGFGRAQTGCHKHREYGIGPKWDILKDKHKSGHVKSLPSMTPPRSRTEH
jgi:hypothetical protein